MDGSSTGTEVPWMWVLLRPFTALEISRAIAANDRFVAELEQISGEHVIDGG